MAQPLRSDPMDTIGQLGRHWGWLLVFGILSVLAGIFALVWPRETAFLLAILFGWYLIVTGIFQFVAAVASEERQAGSRVWMALLGALSFFVGILCLRHVFATILALALLLGLFWIIYGVIHVFTGIAHRETPNRGLTILSGLLSIVAGIIVLSFPAISVLALALVLGIWLIVYGILTIGGSLRLRRARQQLAAPRPTPA
ncbi:MAG TPA: HdeD family acid-resistance protein [Candidatus Dormibacteraeota bacterium]|nr:HdeD family acid-resistance protein [Candidatus Dormibacteraeota bacterium]